MAFRFRIILCIEILLQTWTHVICLQVRQPGQFQKTSTLQLFRGGAINNNNSNTDDVEESRIEVQTIEHLLQNQTQHMNVHSNDDFIESNHAPSMVDDESSCTSCTSSTSKNFMLSIYSIQGKRQYMEDEHFTNQDGSFAAVFDGHGGKAVSRYLRQNLYARYLQAKAIAMETNNSQGELKNQVNEENIVAQVFDTDGFHKNTSDDVIQEKHPKDLINSKLKESVKMSANANTNVTYDDDDATAAPSKPTEESCIQALKAAFQKIDDEVNKISHWSYQGSTAVAICLLKTRDTSSKNAKMKTILISANVGDSRAVLSHGGRAADLTIDHKPNHPSERKRIEKLGGKVIWCGPVHPKTGKPIHNDYTRSNRTRRGMTGVHRINGNLALSRAIGDRSERPLVSSKVDIQQTVLDIDMDDFVIIASDGLWVRYSI